MACNRATTRWCRAASCWLRRLSLPSISSSICFTALSIHGYAMADDALLREPGELETALADARPAPSALREFWLAYAQSRGALLGLGLVVLLIVVAASADLIAPHSPNEQYREYTLAPPM